MASKHFKELVDKCVSIHEKKSHDYASDNNSFSNFERAAQIAGITVDQVFNCLIGIKIARLEELTTSGKTPNNESIEDTYVDLANYSLLKGAYWLSRGEEIVSKEYQAEFESALKKAHELPKTHNVKCSACGMEYFNLSIVHVNATHGACSNFQAGILKEIK